jgi:mono/diheme cytochrome c family protein
VLGARGRTGSVRPVRSARAVFVVVVVAAVALAAAACSSSGTGSTPSDPVLAQGQQIYKQKCSSCHGSKGQGGAGMKLAGRVTQDFPDIQDQIAVIADGRGGMPAWKSQLSDDEMEAVARYERECLGTTC